MLEILGFILVTILWIIVGTSYLKINPIITLLIAALLLSFLIGIPITEIHLVIGSGFWKTVKNQTCSKSELTSMVGCTMA